VTGFAVERSIDPTNFAEIVRVSAISTNYQDTGLATNATYYYRVRAYNSSGFSDYSDVASNKPLSSLPPSLLDGFWDEGIHWSLGRPPSITDSSNVITNPTNKTVAVDFFTAGFFPETLTVSNLVLSAPPGSTNTLILDNMNDWDDLAPLKILRGLSVGNGGVLIITNSDLQVDGLTGGSFSIDGTVMMFSGCLVTTNASFVVGNQSAGSFTMRGGAAIMRDITVAAKIGSGGTLTVTGGVLIANSIIVTNSAGSLIFDAGSLNSAGGTISNGQPFFLGDGTNAANYHLLGGVHTFANGLRVHTNAVLSGCGTISGEARVAHGGTVLAGLRRHAHLHGRCD
jgi:hypothetical protein